MPAPGGRAPPPGHNDILAVIGVVIRCCLSCGSGDGGGGKCGRASLPLFSPGSYAWAVARPRVLLLCLVFLRPRLLVTSPLAPPPRRGIPRCCSKHQSARLLPINLQPCIARHRAGCFIGCLAPPDPQGGAGGLRPRLSAVRGSGPPILLPGGPVCAMLARQRIAHVGGHSNAAPLLAAAAAAMRPP